LRAAVLRDQREVRIEEVTRPSPGPGEVLVRVKSTAICGTDLSIWAGKMRATLPLIPGHESAGEVVEAGPGVTGLGPGDRVVLNPILFCRRCHLCLTGRPNLCENGGLMGREGPGSFAEYVVAEDYRCHKLPDSIGYDDATTLIVLGSVFLGQERVRIAPGTSVAVIGQGVSGLLHTRLAKLSGGNPVVGLSRSQWKLDLALQYGADLVVNSATEDAGEAVRKATGGRGAEVVIESVGSPATLRQAMEMVRVGGVVLAYGVGPASMDGFDAFTLYFKELTVLGSRAMTPSTIDAAIRAVDTGCVDLTPIVTHRFSLAELQSAFEYADKPGARTMRVVVRI